MTEKEKLIAIIRAAKRLFLSTDGPIGSLKNWDKARDMWMQHADEVLEKEEMKSTWKPEQTEV